MHSPLRSAIAGSSPWPNSSVNHPGRSPPATSPSTVASAHPPHERGRDGAPAEGRANLVLQVEQAKIVLAPLAHDDPAPALRCAREQPPQLGVDLPLQVPRIGTQPHAAL